MSEATPPPSPEELVDYRGISTRVAQRAMDRLLDFVEGKIKQRWAKHKNYTRAEFSLYMQAQRNRCGLVRTLVYNNQSAKLADIYVPLRVRLYGGSGRTLRTNDVSSSELIEQIYETRNDEERRESFSGALSGPAGAGKSFFMRHLYLKMAERDDSKVPVFIEARELNDEKPLEFFDIVVKAFKVCGCTISKEQAIEGLKSGIFCILIDGFDELRLSLEKHYAKELDRAAERYPSCPLFVSGRPSELLISSNHFDNCELLPLDEETSISLVEKLDFDQATKKAFTKEIRTELWETHKEFLEIPLLNVVMLITYSDAGRISQRQHEFYEDAYNALWSKHDARKQAGYEREKYTSLDKQEFLRLVSAFCASSYLAEHFAMRERDFSMHFRTAIDLTGISVGEPAFIKDMTISTSLLVLEGNMFRFSHRSFQEFLCANYILDLSDSEYAVGVEAASARYGTDSVLSFIKSMNTERFERLWVLPRLSAAIRELQRAKDEVRHYPSLVEGSGGKFLEKLRDIYCLSPTNSQIYAAVDSERHMGKRLVLELGQLENNQTKLFQRDINGLLKLHSHLLEMYQQRAESIGALFRPVHSDPD